MSLLASRRELQNRLACSSPREYLRLLAFQVERYTEEFDPRTGCVGIEIWLPERK